MKTPRKLLVIDDEPEIGEIVKDFLDEQGYITLLATDAKQGLALLEKEHPDIILLDILLPEIDGLECLEKIRQIDEKVIVVVASGLQDEQVAKKAIQKGAYDYILKPFDLSYLQNNILGRVFPNS
ncbi:MAG: response regulator [Candidatus Omnitrophica bacterium]|nr:response regulator [Candidatus Omnitrophota bacterium]